MLPGHRTKLSLALALVCAVASPAAAQTGSAYGLEDVIEFVKGGLSASAVLSRARNSCINFKVTSSVADRLRGAGASESLIDGLRGVCYKSDSKGGDAGDHTTPRDVPRPNPPKPSHKDPPKRIVPIPTPDYTSQPFTPLTDTPNNGVVSWNFLTSRPITSGHYNNCQYDYTPSGYTVRVLEYGGSCLDGSTQEWEANLRVSADATPVSGASGYTYGLRFGISDDPTVGYYALEVSTYGHFQISRYRNSKWEVLVPWQNGSGINTSSSNRITADIRGSVVSITINGINQYTYQAAAPVRGRAGFGIIGFDKEGPFPTVTFRGFSVSGEKAVAQPVVPPAPPPVVTPQPISPTTGGIVYDFRSSRPLSTGRYGNCQYDYSSSGYMISIADTAGYICLDGPVAVQPANVRVSATSQVTNSGSGLMYGLRFGYKSEPSTDYYLFELDESDRVKLSRYHEGRWDPLLQWQTISGVHSPSSGIPNVLSAQISGASVTLWVNGAQVGSYTAPEEITGKAGFGITGYSGALPTVTFSKFSITPLTGPVSPTVTPTTGAVYYDLSSQQPLTSGVYGKCRYEYTNGGYTISVDQPGSTCIDGPAGDRPASIRVSTTARGIRGGTGYTYGLRIGYTTDQNIGYYAYEISEGGNFQLSRYRQNAWEVLIPWTSTSAVNAASTGIPNEISVEVRGTSLTLYANGSQVGTYQATYPPVGPAGFGIIGYNQSLTLPAVVFTKFSITPLY